MSGERQAKRYQDWLRENDKHGIPTLGITSTTAKPKHEIEGVLKYLKRVNDPDILMIEDTSQGYDEPLESWVADFQGKRVRITVEILEGE